MNEFNTFSELARLRREEAEEKAKLAEENIDETVENEKLMDKSAKKAMGGMAKVETGVKELTNIAKMFKGGEIENAKMAKDFLKKVVKMGKDAEKQLMKHK